MTKNPTAAKELVPLLLSHEIALNLKAQNEFAGKDDMAAIGFAQPFVQAFSARDRETEQRIREIGSRLGWRRNGPLLPSMSFLSRNVGRERDYKFLYQGTSRFVHFSTAEIFRRAWGRKGKLELG